jgi:hypothetical protein
MLIQPVARRRCLSCQRWQGERVVVDAAQVGTADETVQGLCREGPWDGNPRGVKNAFGRWVRWLALPEDNASSTSPAPLKDAS